MDLDGDGIDESPEWDDLVQRGPPPPFEPIPNHDPSQPRQWDDMVVRRGYGQTSGGQGFYAPLVDSVGAMGQRMAGAPTMPPNHFPRQMFPPGMLQGMNRLHPPAPPRPGMPGPIAPPDALGQPDPRIMQQVQEKEQAIQMIDQRDDVAPWQKEHAKAILRSAIQKIDPRGQYQQGSPYRTQSQIEKMFGQGVMRDPNHPDLFWHLDPRGVPKPFQYKQPAAPPPPIDFHGHLQQHTGMGLKDWLALGVAPHIDPKGAIHFHNLPQVKPQKDLEREAHDKRYMEMMKHKTVEIKDAEGTATGKFRYPTHEEIMQGLRDMDRGFKEHQYEGKIPEKVAETIQQLQGIDPAEAEARDRARAAQLNQGTHTGLPRNLDDLTGVLPGGQ